MQILNRYWDTDMKEHRYGVEEHRFEHRCEGTHMEQKNTDLNTNMKGHRYGVEEHRYERRYEGTQIWRRRTQNINADMKEHRYEDWKSILLMPSKRATTTLLFISIRQILFSYENRLLQNLDLKNYGVKR